MSDSNGKTGALNIVFELFRFITPALVAITLAYVNSINLKIDRLDDKVFKHLTNDEIHYSRSAVVDRNTFDLYQKMRDGQMNKVDIAMVEIKSMIKDLQCDLSEERKSTRR